LAANRFRQAIVGCEQVAFQLLGKRDVRSIIGREVRSELENPTEQRLMPVTNERQIQIVLEGIRGAYRGEPLHQQAPPQRCRDLDVTERRSMKVGIGRLEDTFNFGGAVRLQQVLDKR
jgi:hypothetical protein